MNITSEVAALTRIAAGFQQNANQYLQNASKPVLEEPKKPEEGMGSATVDNSSVANELSTLEFYTSMIQAERSYEAVVKVIQTKQDMSETLNKLL